MKVASQFTFDLPTRIAFGNNTIDQLPDLINELGFKHPLIVTDKGIREAGLIDGFLARLDNAGMTHGVFDDIEPNPKDYNVDRGVAQIIKRGCDSIITVGGGSPMDCAKAMAAVATLGGHTREYINRGRIKQDVLPIIAVPTTAGTGSEVTFGAVITDSERKFKFTIKGTVEVHALSTAGTFDRLFDLLIQFLSQVRFSPFTPSRPPQRQQLSGLAAGLLSCAW